MTKILILEDDFDLGIQWQQRLEEDGHDVILTRDPDQAIAELDKSAVDLLVTDVLIHDSDAQPQPRGGLTVLAHIALNLENKPKVIAVSGAPFDVLKHAEVLKANRVIQKPVTTAAIADTVNELLGS